MDNLNLETYETFDFVR